MNRPARGRLRHSITKQITLTMAALVAGTVLLCWLLNVTLLEWYYTENKQDTLLNSFDVINTASQKGTLSGDDFDVEFERICNNGNLTIMIMSSDNTIVRSSTNDNEALLYQFIEVIRGSLERNDGSTARTRVVQETDQYMLIEKNDTRMGSDYMILWGTLDDGNLILMRTPIESIKESVTLSNRLLTYVGVLAVILSMVIIYFVTRKITRPLVELTGISQKMANLDFNAKYAVHGDNEVERLGMNMNQLSETLERTISELKSANNELKIDNERKTEIDEMRKEFLSNVSHELKTPLALIQGYAEGLQECVQDDPQSRDFYCEVIMDEADKMNQMVKKLLTLNQLEFGNDSVTMERFDMTELIRGVVNSASLLAEQSGAEVIFEEPVGMYVWADEFKVEEVIMNYLSNAIHHVDFEKKITISYERKADCVRVSVFNTGKPIPAEDIEHVWVKFYKVDKARTREYGGSGIGLSIVKAIMDSFNRECGVINHENGVEFWMELDTRNN